MVYPNSKKNRFPNAKCFATSSRSFYPSLPDRYPSLFLNTLMALAWRRIGKGDSSRLLMILSSSIAESSLGGSLESWLSGLNILLALDTTGDSCFDICHLFLAVSMLDGFPLKTAS